MKLPNGYGSIVNLGKNRRKPFGVRVTAGWTDDNKQKYKYVGYFEKRTDALNFLAEYNKNPLIVERNITFIEVWDKWHKRHFENVSQITINSYNAAFKKLKHLHSMPMIELRTFHFQEVIDKHTAAPARNIKVVLKLIYDFCLENDIVNKNYALFLKVPKAEHKVKTIFSQAEIQQILANEGQFDYDVLITLLYTGMRVNELFEMLACNVDLNKRVMVGGNKTANGRGRTIPIHKDLVPILKRNMGTKYLFEYKNKKVVYISFWKRVGTYDLFQNHDIHETRHTFISRANQLGFDQLLLKRIVGHSSRDVTSIYTHFDTSHLIDAIDSFSYL